MNTGVVILVVAAVLALVLGSVVFLRRRRSQEMRHHYGAEYLAAVDDLGDRRKAEAELKRREKRVQSFDIRPLGPAEADQYVERWRQVQAAFVDDPGAAIAQADQLLGEVMHARGYPVTDFEQRAADLSVEHPKLVADYRVAHEVALRHGRGQVGTEDLRRAMLHYRELFADLVEAPEPRRAEEQRTFSKEPEDERAARIRDEQRDEQQDQGADDRAARAPRRGQRRDRPGDGRTPLV